jgi:hypothetical protein
MIQKNIDFRIKNFLLHIDIFQNKNKNNDNKFIIWEII